MLRVIAGRARGKRLQTPAGAAVTRPTAERTREAVFGSIQFALTGAAVLDVFAGSGAMGIEALSRGAARCVFVDNSPAAVASIRANLAQTGFAGEVLAMSFERALQSVRGPFDFIFMDPPYAAGLYQPAAELIHARGLLAPTGKLFAEHAGGLALEGFAAVRERKYGKAYVTVFVEEQSCER